MGHEIPPAIRRDWQSVDSAVEVLSTPKNDVTFHRGLGDSGRKVQHVRHECPRCRYDQMVRLVDVSPTERNGVQYWCLNPQCQYFVADELSWALKPHPQMVPETPMVWQQTRECDDCGNRWSEEVTKEQYRRMDVEDGIVVSSACPDCLPRYEEVVET